MSVLDSKKTYKNLKSKGFTDSQHNSSDHKYLNFFYEGKLILHTKISHSNKDIGDYLIKAMCEQCKLSKSEFMDLANCPMSKENYISILKQNGII